MKVQLINERGDANPWVRRNSAPIKAMKPFYEKEGAGYVHRIRSGRMHFDARTGELSHTGLNFWCGVSGLIYPPGKKGRSRPASALDHPTPGRVVCATCEARAIGAMQVGHSRIGCHFVRYKPHSDFFPTALDAGPR